MSDEFVRLSEDKKSNLDSYLSALDRYLLGRYNKIIKEQKFLDKIRSKIGISWDFIQLYEKAKEQSKKNNTFLILEYIDLLAKTKNIGDDWITNDATRAATDRIKTRLLEESKKKFDEVSKSKSDLKKLSNEILKTLENESEKIKGYEKQPLTEVKNNISTAAKVLSKTYNKIPELKN